MAENNRDNSDLPFDIMGNRVKPKPLTKRQLTWGKSQLQRLQSQYFRACGSLVRARQNLNTVNYFLGKESDTCFVVSALRAQLDRKYQEQKKKLQHPPKPIGHQK